MLFDNTMSETKNTDKCRTQEMKSLYGQVTLFTGISCMFNCLLPYSVEIKTRVLISIFGVITSIFFLRKITPIERICDSSQSGRWWWRVLIIL